MTSLASDMAGTHFGETKDAASMARQPASASFRIKRILSLVLTMVDSFCRPSRGPTSTILTDVVVVDVEAVRICNNLLRRRHPDARDNMKCIVLFFVW